MTTHALPMFTAEHLTFGFPGKQILDDDTITRLRVRAAHHQITMEEEARRILRQAVTPKKHLRDISLQFFGTKSGVELELPQHTPHETSNFA